MRKHPATIMILAAGIGSRLKPLTDVKPKALVNYKGKPMIMHVLEHILSQGFRRIVINVHHHGSQLIEYLENNTPGNLEVIISDERNMLMDTGGGIIHARSLLDEGVPFIVHNVDINSNIDLNKLYEYHLQHLPLATLAVKNRITSRELGFDDAGNLSGWRNNGTGESIIVPGKTTKNYAAFSGIQVIDPKIFDIIKEKQPFPIIPKYLELAGQYPVKLFDHSQDNWIDMASVNHIDKLS